MVGDTQTTAKGGARNRLIAGACAGLVLAMGGMAYAAVPLYELFCRVTGYGGTTQTAEAGDAVVSEREVRVRFDANVRDVDVDFRPQTPSVHVDLGQVFRVNYLAENKSERPVTVTSTFNVTPPATGAYFNKIECFCFTEQVLAPNESRVMPVEFFVDPELSGDRDLDHVGTITLSYTMFPGDSSVGVPAAAPVQAALAR